MRLSKQYIGTTDGSRRTGLSMQSPVWDYPERILQIGEGNFLRGFVDWAIHRSNMSGSFKGRIVVVAPRPTGRHNIEKLNAQDGLYTVWLRGLRDGKVVDSAEVVTPISRGIDPYSEWEVFLRCAEQRDLDIVVSNTTEAGLAYEFESSSLDKPTTSFPSKLTKFLYRRYQYFDGDPAVGMTIVPCELVDDNADVLRDLILRHARDWDLPDDFCKWITTYNRFCNTLVDRIVTGSPDEEGKLSLEEKFGCQDELVTVGEPFMLWAIEGDDDIRQRLPIVDATNHSFDIRIEPSVAPYRLIKVRILNGAHTAMSSIAQMAGMETVGQTLDDPQFRQFVRGIMEDEIAPVLMEKGIEKNEVSQFINSTIERFQNPFVRHELKSLSLNGISKICVRLLSTMRDYCKIEGTAPRLLTLAFAAHLIFYRNARKADGSWQVQDDVQKMTKLWSTWERHAGQCNPNVVNDLLALKDVWGTNLNELPDFSQMVMDAVNAIDKYGTKGAIQQWLTTTV